MFTLQKQYNDLQADIDILIRFYNENQRNLSDIEDLDPDGNNPQLAFTKDRILTALDRIVSNLSES